MKVLCHENYIEQFLKLTKELGIDGDDFNLLRLSSKEFRYINYPTSFYTVGRV